MMSLVATCSFQKAFSGYRSLMAELSEAVYCACAQSGIEKGRIDKDVIRKTIAIARECSSAACLHYFAQPRVAAAGSNSTSASKIVSALEAVKFETSAASQNNAIITLSAPRVSASTAVGDSSAIANKTTTGSEPTPKSRQWVRAMAAHKDTGLITLICIPPNAVPGLKLYNRSTALSSRNEASSGVVADVHASSPAISHGFDVVPELMFPDGGHIVIHAGRKLNMCVDDAYAAIKHMVEIPAGIERYSYLYYMETTPT